MNKLLYYPLYLFVFWFAASQKPSLDVVILKTDFIALDGKRINDYFPADSIFIAGNKGLEPLVKSNDVLIGDKLSRSFEVSGYNVIDFAKKKFANVMNLDSSVSCNRDFKDKKVGLDILFVYYSDEKVTREKVMLNKKSYDKVSFISNGAQTKGATVSVIMHADKPFKSYPSLFPNLESAFGGFVKEITVSFPNQGMLKRTVLTEIIQNDKVAKFFKILKN